VLPADHKIDGGPSVLFDAVAILPSDDGGEQLAIEAAAVNFLRDAYGHLKVIAYLPSAGAAVRGKGGITDVGPDDDAGLIALPTPASTTSSPRPRPAASGRASPSCVRRPSLIIGGGPAGLTAAISAQRLGRSSTLFR
jgi:hypothetical protein